MTSKGVAELMPMDLFADITLLNEEDKQPIFDYCSERNHLAYIDYHPKYERWAFHTLVDLSAHMVFRKPIADECVSREGKPRICEADIEEAFVKYLEKEGRAPQRQVRCKAGIIDILTDDAIYEVKRDLDRSSIITAIGELLLYQKAVPRNNLVIVGRNHHSLASLQHYLDTLGIKVIRWTI